MAQPKRRASDRRQALYPLVALLVAVAVLAFAVFHYFLATFSVAASLTILMTPTQRRLTRLLGGRGSLAAAVLVLLTTVVILVPVLLSAAVLSQQAVSFFEWVRPRLQPSALGALYREGLPAHYPWLHDFLRFDEEETTRAVSGVLSSAAQAANGLVQEAVARLTSALFELFIFLMSLFFLLRDGSGFRAEVRSISPLSERQEQEIFDHLGRTIRGVLEAMVVAPLAQGFLAMVGFLIFGVPSPVLWGVAVVLAALIPILGSPIGWVPAVLYLAARGEAWQWSGMLVYGVVVISGIDYLVKPLFLKGAAQIHPLAAFLATIGGLFAFGPSGFLIGPVILSLVLSAVKLYKMDVLRVPDAAPPVAARAGETGSVSQGHGEESPSPSL